MSDPLAQYLRFVQDTGACTWAGDSVCSLVTQYLSIFLRGKSIYILLCFKRLLLVTVNTVCKEPKECHVLENCLDFEDGLNFLLMDS